MLYCVLHTLGWTTSVEPDTTRCCSFYTRAVVVQYLEDAVNSTAVVVRSVSRLNTWYVGNIHPSDGNQGPSRSSVLDSPLGNAFLLVARQHRRAVFLCVYFVPIVRMPLVAAYVCNCRRATSSKMTSLRKEGDNCSPSLCRVSSLAWDENAWCCSVCVLPFFQRPRFSLCCLMAPTFHPLTPVLLGMSCVRSVAPTTSFSSTKSTRW